MRKFSKPHFNVLGVRGGLESVHDFIEEIQLLSTVVAKIIQPARPLKRAIQEHLLDPLATKLLTGEFKPGDKIKVSTKGGELEFAKK